MALKKEVKDEISILEISQGEVTFAIVGTTPLIFNRINAKTARELLLPRGGVRTRADKAASLKHSPIDEYRDSVHRRIGSGPTRLQFPSSAFKGTLKTAALDIPGVFKTEIGRLTWIAGSQIDIYGIPKLCMASVRMKDINRTPDIRTRAILPEWACTVTVNFITPKLAAKSIANLMAAGGRTCGIGDNRQEKGHDNFGSFRLVDGDDKDFRRIIKEGGMKAQDEALSKPIAYDADTEELLSWFSAEIIRIRDTPAPKKSTKGKQKDEAA